MAIEFVGQGAPRCHKHALVVGCIRELLTRPWKVELEHSFWEGNFVADLLAKMGVRQEEALCVLDLPPAQLSFSLQDAAIRVFFQRGMT